MKARNLFLFLHLHLSNCTIRGRKLPSQPRYLPVRLLVIKTFGEQWSRNTTSSLGTVSLKLISVWLTFAFKWASRRLLAGNKHFWTQQPSFDALPFGRPEQARHVFGFTFQREAWLFNLCALFKILLNRSTGLKLILHLNKYWRKLRTHLKSQTRLQHAPSNQKQPVFFAFLKGQFNDCYPTAFNYKISSLM